MKRKPLVSQKTRHSTGIDSTKNLNPSLMVRNWWLLLTSSVASVTVHVAPTMELDVYDRVGGGDGFASGLFYGLLSGAEPDEALRLGWAHGALLTTFSRATRPWPPWTRSGP